jgi:glycosyltransferase involved in cell wall biosynthesis
VLRQCDLLEEMGHPPLVIAPAHDEDRIPHALARLPVMRPTFAFRLSTVMRQVPAHLSLMAAELGFWAAGRHRLALGRLREAKPALVLANDWPALVVAARYKRENGCKIHYDTHEFATLEFDERAFWRAVYKPMVTRLEARHIHAADGVSTVGPLLARELQALYRLAQVPAVIRNMPEAIHLDDGAEAQWPLRILYHGQLLADRGIETVIDSVAQWRTPHVLLIRGDGPTAYVEVLKKRAAATGCGARIRFEAAVAPSDVMPVAAATADVGVHFTPLDTKQRHFSMPNKLFEYVGAGLAVAVSPGADLRLIVESHGIGIVSADPTAAGAADAINTLDQASVSAFKAAARKAARILCWDHEKTMLQACLSPLLPSRTFMRQASIRTVE